MLETKLKLTKEDLSQYTVGQLLILMPENYYLYKDCGCWQVYNDDNEPMGTAPSDYNPRIALEHFLLNYEFDYDDIMWHRIVDVKESVSK